MDYVEAPSIQSVSRRLQYTPIKWLSKTSFEELMRTDATAALIHPHLVDDGGGDDEDGRSLIRRRIYVGKSIQTNTSEGVQHGYDHLADREQPPRISLEIIGSVVCNYLTGQWELHVSHASNEIVIKNDFLVLSIEDEHAFEWKPTQKNQIPKSALRGCIDRYSHEYFYIGRTRPAENSTMKPRYFSQGREWRQFTESIPARFGKVHVSHECLYIGFNNLEIAFQSYDVLCLRPSPAPLSILTRLFVREKLHHDNDIIEKINQPGKRKYLPDNLVQFVKYPSFLSVGEYMIKGERLIREDGKYELLIDHKNQLICRSIVHAAEMANLNEGERIDFKSSQVVRVIDFHEVDSIWLHRFQCVFYLRNERVQTVKNFFDKSPEYRLFINQSNPPNIEISEIDESYADDVDAN